MRHCTICGAAAREGAKFCTSCGARLPVDEPSAQGAAPTEETATLTAVPYQPEDAPEDTMGEPATADAAGDPESTTVDTTDQPDEFASSWPESGDSEEVAATSDTPETVTAPAPDSFATDADQEPDRTPDDRSSWSWGQTSSEPRETASSFATDADQDPQAARSSSSWSWSAFGKSTDEPASADAPASPTSEAGQDAEGARSGAASWSWGTSAEAPEEEPAPGSADATAEPVSDEVDTTGIEAEVGTTGTAADVTSEEDVDVDHHGASQWESWAPVAAGASTALHADDPGRSVRELLDELAGRIDRLVSPATMASREVDPDALADQLATWSRAVPGIDDVLTVVQAVRKQPRDLDALLSLADRAPDLELLVRHYQSITASSDRWAGELRRPREGSTDEPTA